MTNINKSETVFVVSNKNLEAIEIAKMLENEPDVNVFVSNQKRFRESTWQNVEGEIRFNVNSFQNKHCEYQCEVSYFGEKTIESKTGTLKEALANNGTDIKSVANIIGINLNGDELYTGNHIKTTAEKSALEQVAEILDVELTFDQVLVAAYARGGVNEIVKLGEILQMREDELVAKIVDIKMKDSNELGNIDAFYDYYFNKTLSFKESCDAIEYILKNAKSDNVQIVNTERNNNLCAICQNILQRPLITKREDSKFYALFAPENICSQVIEQFKGDGVGLHTSSIVYISKNSVDEVLDYINTLDLEYDINEDKQDIESTYDDVEIGDE